MLDCPTHKINAQVPEGKLPYLAMRNSRALNRALMRSLSSSGATSLRAALSLAMSDRSANSSFL